MNTKGVYSAILTSSNQFGITIQATGEGAVIIGLSQDGSPSLLLKEGQKIKVDVTPKMDGTAMMVVKFEPHLPLDYTGNVG